MKAYFEPARQTEVIDSAQVVVAGGGLAGCVAAIAAARNGADVLLVESSGVLGGTATAGLMSSFNGFRNERPPNELQTVRGIAQEIVDRLREQGAACGMTAHGDFGPLRPGEAPYAVSFDPEALKRLLVEMLWEAGARVRLYTFVCGAVVQDACVRALIVESHAGRHAVEGRIVVDATGNGDVAARAGVPFDAAPAEDEHLMSVTLMYRVAGVEPERFDRPHLAIGRTATVWGPSRRGVDGTDPAALTHAHAEALMELPEHLERLRRQPGFENCYLVQTASHLGVRETRRIRGEYTITERDAVEGRRFEDVVAISSNPVPAYYGERFFFEHEGFDIPYRSLVPEKIDGLLLAGRCISAEQVPFQSARSMAPLMAISQASGTAAALCVQQGVQPRHLDVRLLQRTLLEQGAELRLEQP